ncbi:hypothetical protein Moror_12151 [Moniliophthora roreri MCA 2997]|uniref:ER-bound oxygenase mpaB/mpaB'/Rubber oxygenase catalytic domain-containing protein n=1 Tax=Moniliophthora roreri (strain MCA 2997) TaxID=1381753 RepID=V2WLF6_MONRO|nr:hypothetical protein Moror_12151 [Moniliophthora roreri MCA 2997]
MAFSQALESLSAAVPWHTLTIPSIILLSWLSIVRTFRWRRYNHIHRVYGPKYAAGQLTPEEAQEIVGILTRYEMPLILEYALAFALFKTYGIPSISKILAATKEFKSDETVSKRYADVRHPFSSVRTRPLRASFLKHDNDHLATWVQCPISGYTTLEGIEKPVQDPRANLAIARVNYLHSQYNIKWAEKYGWRALSPLESHAMYVLWVEVGKRMGIKDIPESEEAFKAWVEDYEAKNMVPAQTNHDVATYTTNELIYPVPHAFGLKNFARKLSIAALEDNVRVAMMQPEQPKYLRIFLDSLLKFTAWQIRYFHLPRPQWNYYGQIKLDLPQFEEGQEPLMTPLYFQPRPWYKPESTWLIGQFWDWFLVKAGKHADVPSKQFKSEGYRLDTMGPLKFENAGREEVYRMAERLSGCPVPGAWRTLPRAH